MTLLSDSENTVRKRRARTFTSAHSPLLLLFFFFVFFVYRTHRDGRGRRAPSLQPRTRITRKLCDIFPYCSIQETSGPVF